MLPVISGSLWPWMLAFIILNISGEYFKSVADHTRQLDTTRPVTLVCNAQWDQVRVMSESLWIRVFSLKDHASQHFDIIAFNRYYAWYSDSGHTEVIKEKLYNDLANWRRARGNSAVL